MAAYRFINKARKDRIESGIARHVAGSDRWFHLRWMVPTEPRYQYRMERMLELVEKEGTIRYCLITRHDDSCEIKKLSDSTTTEPHYHAIVWYSDRTAAITVAKMFDLVHMYDEGKKPNYYCQPRYSQTDGFYEYIEKYVKYKEWGTAPKRESVVKKEKVASDERTLRAIEWVKGHNGGPDAYREQDPIHYARNFARLMMMFGNQEDFTQDRREFQSYWIWGGPATGKSQIVNALWPGAYVFRDGRFWDGYDPRKPEHRIVTMKDINSEWLLKKGTVIGMKNMTDMDGKSIDKKFQACQVVNHARVIVTSNFSIHDCVKGTCKDEIVGANIEIEALKRRYKEIHIDEFLRLCGMKLKDVRVLNALKGKQVPSRMLFDVVGPNLIPHYGEELLPPPPPLTEEQLREIEENIHMEDEDKKITLKRKRDENDECTTYKCIVS